MILKTLCEYMDCPTGLNMEKPRFSWAYENVPDKVVQMGYRIIVWKNDEKGEVVWDSQDIESSETVNVFYQGKPLETAGIYCYRVSAVLNNGTVVESKPAYFSMGLMREDAAWKAEWIGSAFVKHSCYWYRKEFHLSKPVKQATAFVLSSCYYTLTVNGEKADDTLLNNVTSDYQKTLYYATYDITDKIRGEGANALGMTVGYGWENLRLAEDGVGWEENSFSVEIYILYEDGTTEWIYSDLNGWYYTFEGPILYNSIYNGEIYDARKEIIGFDRPGYVMDEKWFPAVNHESPGGKVKSQYLEPIKIIKELEPQYIYKNADGSCTVDFGQNFAGWMRLKVQGTSGTKIEMQYAELEHEDHTVNTISLRRAKARDIYYLKGKGTEIYEPSFTFHGFRYVQIFGLPEEPRKEMFTGCVIYSAVKRVGLFESDNKLLNQIYSNIVWTESSNLHGIPTDCPQRDERLGWLNDMTVRNECAIYNYRLPQLYEKWMQDIRDTQGKTTGAIADTAPFRRYGIKPGDPVSSSFLLVPWNIYVHYGDKKILEENYEPIKRWVCFLLKNSDNYIVRYSQMGDWAGPIMGTDIGSNGGGAVSTITPTVLIATGYLYYNCLIVSKMAEVLGKEAEQKHYLELSKKVADSFQKKFFNEKEGYYAQNSQASNTFPLYLGIVPEKYKDKVLKNLVDDIKQHGNHFTTGNLCSRYIVEVLLRNGQEDLAYDVLNSTEYPGWGYMVANGATTIWERWEKVTEDGVQSAMASYNHPMNGAMGVAFAKHLAGIVADEKYPAFKRFAICPVLPKKLNHVSFIYESVKGVIKSEWRKGEDNITMNIRIPVNSEADVYVPVYNGGKKAQIFIGSEKIYDGEYLKDEYRPLDEKQYSDYVHIVMKAGKYSLKSM